MYRQNPLPGRKACTLTRQLQAAHTHNTPAAAAAFSVAGPGSPAGGARVPTVMEDIGVQGMAVGVIMSQVSSWDGLGADLLSTRSEGEGKEEGRP